MVNRRSDTDLGNTQSAPRGGESDCVLDRHGRRGWSPGGRMPGRDAHGQACFMNAVNISMPYTGLTRRNTVFIFVWLRHRTK